MKNAITIEATISAPLSKIWEYWTLPKHIINWNNASDDWHTTKSENDVRTGGRFLSRMEAKDGSFGFDFEGTYTEIEKHKLISYVMDDDRKATTSFKALSDYKTKIVTTFEAEDTNPIQMQKDGWQAILNNFKKYTEA
ncbi:SRPBCC family protein [Cellulophaga tyrosinoxydans]|uniref:Uncharacterized conserved protein YndB, AHSA1/START domain n=1 Tax=Cellulophaga tyrosinoxydans TaxID=504486 RepID=A0A1W1YGB9_9FLAO|nr:SRPBCC family protein [Cellulophaga tyrosinoxydans]SMC35215.1 Uncharacterized conserved protein YndB, AHSA1/START domain [Cellulophaga tyrosinoxydans]